ncbi:MAG: hypothetical protein IKM48_05600 [Clostridia bacterium]|nr:hypothetical protein [Clostridia bacterium]
MKQNNKKDCKCSPFLLFIKPIGIIRDTPSKRVDGRLLFFTLNRDGSKVVRFCSIGVTAYADTPSKRVEDRHFSFFI